MPQLIPIGMLAPGTPFKMPAPPPKYCADNHWRGVVVSANECATTVEARSDDTAWHRIQWSNATMVHRLDEIESRVALDKTNGGGEFQCPNCDKVCSSKSGLTLHMKHQHSLEES